MISVLATPHAASRAFGWVQDPSSWRSLCDVVAVFDEHSAKHRELADKILPRLVEERDGREALLQAMQARPLAIRYGLLVGTSFQPRSLSRCNGIVQAAVKGQGGRPFIGDWPADNYLRWAHCLGFVRYDYGSDSFSITGKGLALTAARGEGEALSPGESALLTEALLAYPPAIRVLELLCGEEVHLTKFELGRQLGFVGEDGFTSMPQTVLLRSLAGADPAEQKKMKANWEGSSDKYARMIASWMEKLGLVARVPKRITVQAWGGRHTEEIGQAYKITARGVTALRRAQGGSRHRRIAKQVCWEMLATKGADRDYLRTRRALILKFLDDHKSGGTAEDILRWLASYRLTEQVDTVRDDVQGLQNIGIHILCREDRFILKDTLGDFVIPLPANMAQSDLSACKEALRGKLHLLPHEYLALLDLAYDSKQNRLFEMKTLELLTEECGYQGLHLGGSRRPDGILYTVDAGYGIIVDTKAYAKGYNLPISQADEMERYIGENQTRSVEINPNAWWRYFAPELNTFHFLFVAGHFVGHFQSQLERISRNKGITGGAAAIRELLLLTEAVKAGSLDHAGAERQLFQNDEFRLTI